MTITEKHFPLQGVGQREVVLELVHPNKEATTKEVLEQLNSLGMEPAKIEHLLAFGAAYRHVQKKFPVIALGSVWVYDFGHRYCPYLDFHDSRRELNLGWSDDIDHWNDDCRFLAVRK